MNKAILLGRLTKDPELRTTSNGVSVCSFTLAIDRPYKNARGERETDFIPCVTWRQTAEFTAKYFRKGERLAAVGSIQPRHWDDEQGERHYITEVICDEIYFADGKRDSSNRGQDNNEYTRRTERREESDDSFLPSASDETSLPFEL